MDSPQKLVPLKQLEVPLLLKPYVWVALALWLLAAALVLALGYRDSFLFINRTHNAFLDFFFQHFTNLGDSLVASSILVLLFWRRNPPLLLTAILAITITGLTAQLFKNTVFNEWDRPQKIFEGTGLVHFFDHERANYKSMPSGHATTAFTATLVLAYLFQHKDVWAQVVLAIMAGLVCYSRVYVGMHFLGDVLAGGMLGAVLTVPVVRWLYPRCYGLFAKASAPRLQLIGNIMRAVAAVCLIVGLWGQYKYNW